MQAAERAGLSRRRLIGAGGKLFTPANEELHGIGHLIARALGELNLIVGGYIRMQTLGYRSWARSPKRAPSDILNRAQASEGNLAWLRRRPRSEGVIRVLSDMNYVLLKKCDLHHKKLLHWLLPLMYSSPIDVIRHVGFGLGAAPRPEACKGMIRQNSLIGWTSWRQE